MMNERVYRELEQSGVPFEERSFDVPFETTVQSARMLETDMEHIAKTMVFRAPSGAITLIAPGNAKVDNQKFRQQFGVRPTMLKADELMELTGFEPGAVSPVGIASSQNSVYMDVSLMAFQGETVFPSGGTDRCAIAIMPENLYKAAECCGVVDVCKENS